MSNQKDLEISKVKKRRLVIGLSYVIVMVLFFYFSGIFNLPAATVLGPGRNIEPKSGFVVGDLLVHPVVGQPNETINVSISVANNNSTWGIYVLELRINGVKEAGEAVNVDAGGREEVSFKVTRDLPGDYVVFINGLYATFAIVP